MTTPTTPERAMEIAAEHDSDTPTHAALISLSKQVEALTQENKNLLAANRYSIDAEQQAMDEVRSLTKERDGLTQAVIDRNAITRGLLECIESFKLDAKQYQWLMTPRRTEQHNRASFLLHEGRITEAAMEIVAAMKAAS